MSVPRGPINHGTIWSYEGRKCRCPECRAFMAARRRAIRRKAKGLPNPSEPVCPGCQTLWKNQLALGRHMSWCPRVLRRAAS